MLKYIIVAILFVFSRQTIAQVFLKNSPDLTQQFNLSEPVLLPLDELILSNKLVKEQFYNGSWYTANYYFGKKDASQDWQEFGCNYHIGGNQNIAYTKYRKTNNILEKNGNGQVLRRKVHLVDNGDSLDLYYYNTYFNSSSQNIREFWYKMFFTYSGSKDTNYFKYKLSYTAGKVTSVSRYFGLDSLNMNTLLGKYLYNYDANGNLIFTADLDYLQFSGGWDTANKLTYTYNSANKPVCRKKFESYKGVMYPLKLDSFFYNLNNKMTGYRSYNYDSTMKKWKPDEYFDYVYDTDGKLITVFTGSTNNNYWIIDRKLEIPYSGNNPTTALGYTRSGTVWSSTPYFHLVFAGEFYLSATSANKHAELLVYPNPAKSVLNISGLSDCTKINNSKVLDVTGKTVYTAQIKFDGNQLQILVDDLVPGAYLLVAECKDGSRYLMRFTKE